MPIPTFCTEVTTDSDTLDTEVCMEDTWDITLPLWLPLELPPSLRLPPSTLPDLPLPRHPPLPEDTLLLDVMSPTLLELSMLPRGRLRLMPRLTPTFSTADSDTLDTPDTDMLVSPTPDSETLVWDTTTVLDTLTTPDRLPFLPLDPSTSLVLPPLLLPL